MRWPFGRRGSSDRLVVSWAAGTLAYVRAGQDAGGVYTLRQCGVERQGDASLDDFVKRLQGLGLKGLEADVMLRPEQYQLLQIEAPAVEPEELRSAARYQIREMIDLHVDDITLDVMRVGDGQQKGSAHLFVVATSNATVRSVLELGTAMQWSVSVIDIQETAQRNLQSAVARREQRLERAHAALVLVGAKQAVLTISANEELFYTRRLDLPEGFLESPWGQGHEAQAGLNEAYAPVQEYVPDYQVGGVSQGADYTDGGPHPGAGSVADERAQRFLVEVQRSLDLWDRSWSSMPLAGLRVYCGERSLELARWLSLELGQSVGELDVAAMFPGFGGAAAAADQALCWPLLGVLMRTDTRQL